MSTELAGVGGTETLFGPLLLKAPSPEFLLVDEESSSTYPLLTPSPPVEFEHPLATETAPVLAFGRQLSPTSIDTLSSTVPAADYGTLPPSLPSPALDNQIDKAIDECPDAMASSSSSSSVLQDTTSSAQLLNPHHYLNLANDINSQENGGIKQVFCGLQLGKSPQDFYFLSWNWPLIRKFCFWGVMSLTVACVCVIIAYITTLPSRCDPPRAWYQGSVVYEIFPASFKDTNKDGIGDIKGIISKIDHLDRLGVRAIRLNSIFPSEHYPEHYDRIANLTRIEPLLGTLDDFKLLVSQLHKHNISLILDIPMSTYFKVLTLQSSHVKAVKDQQQQDSSLNPVHHMIVNNHILNSNGLNTTAHSSEDQGEQRSLVEILQFWLEYGVDGFYLKGLERFVNDDKFEEQVKQWRHMLNRYTVKNDFNKIMICSQNVVKILENNAGIVNSKLNTVLAFFDLVDYRIELLGVDFKQQIDAVQKGVLFSKPNYPWPLWTIGGEDRSRLASRVETMNGTLAALLVNMMLPGTPSIFYGDEIGLDNLHDPDGEREDISHVHQLSPMKWAENGFTQPGVLPWLPNAASHSPTNSVTVISEMSSFRDVTPSIYMHAVWKEGTLIPNCAIRYTDKDLIVVERSYPRRHSYVIIANLGNKVVHKDLSSIYYRGTVILETNSRQDINRYITFQTLVLYPGEAAIVKLDK